MTDQLRMRVLLAQTNVSEEHLVLWEDPGQELEYGQEVDETDECLVSGALTEREQICEEDGVAVVEPRPVDYR